jgi:hypothetical protein
MSLFRRKRDETLNEQLLREAQLAEPDAEPEAAAAVALPPFPGQLGSMDPLYTGLPGRPALERPELWDAQAVAQDSHLKGTRYEFTAVPDGSLVVDDSCDEDLSRLADAVEKELPAPYRAVASRAGAGVWVVTAKKTTVLELDLDHGDQLELSSVDGEEHFAVDGASVDAARAPDLLRKLGETKGSDYAVQAQRLDQNLWDVTASAI